MRLYIKEKVFSWSDRFTVRDEFDHETYFVEGELFSLGKRLHLTDTQGRELACIQQKLWTFLPCYTVSMNGREVAQIRKEFTFFLQRYVIEGLGWEVEGSVWEHEYEIRKHGRRIVSISKEWFTWGDSYMLDIADPADALLALAVVLTIDCVAETRNN